METNFILQVGVGSSAFLFGSQGLPDDDVDDDDADFWKHMHRKEHVLYNRFGGSLSEMHDRAYHRWAGHLARATAGILHMAVRALYGLVEISSASSLFITSEALRPAIEMGKCVGEVLWSCRR